MGSILVASTVDGNVTATNSATPMTPRWSSRRHCAGAGSAKTACKCVHKLDFLHWKLQSETYRTDCLLKINTHNTS